MKYLVPLGRVLYSAIFLMSAPGHFTEKTIGYAASHGVPLASIAVPLSGAMVFVGALSILLGEGAAHLEGIPCFCLAVDSDCSASSPPVSTRPASAATSARPRRA